jgi:hypothetical protein
VPPSFFGATVEEATSVWAEGIRFCEAHSPFSGYLVSVHFGSLAEAASPGAPRDDLELLRRFAQAERGRQEALQRGCSAEESEFAGRAVQLLRVCDTLSLIACHAPEISPPAGALLPLAGGGLRIRLTAEGLLELSPWPFDPGRVQVVFPGATIPPARFESQEELEEALHQAEPAMFETFLVPMAA